MTTTAPVEELELLEGAFPAEETAEELALTTNMYAEIRRRLAERGIPPEEVAFIHDAKTVEERRRLFAAVNAGQVRVLIGSTEKAGTGMNVQERCLAVHQITPPWRPGDIEQQVGRLWRQGNLYPQVFQFVHVTSGSFDGYTWQLLESKARFIAQLSSGMAAGREVDDVSETVLSFSEIKALASGNPKILRKIILDAEIARLEAVMASWKNSLHQARWSLATLESQLAAHRQTLDALQAAITVREAHPAAKFQIELKPSLGDSHFFRPGTGSLPESDCHPSNLETLTDRETAGKRLRALIASGAAVVIRDRLDFVEIGQYRGMSLRVTAARTSNFGEFIHQAYIQVGGHLAVDSHRMEIGVGESDAGIAQSVETRVRSLDGEAEKSRSLIQAVQGKIASIEAELARPWDHQERYDALRREHDALVQELDVEQQTPTSALAAPAIRQADEDTDAAVFAALDAIAALHADPGVLARFGLEADDPLPISAESLAEMEREIAAKQATLAFGQALLQAIPGAAGAETLLAADWQRWAEKRNTAIRAARKKRLPETPPGQMALF